MLTRSKSHHGHKKAGSSHKSSPELLAQTVTDCADQCQTEPPNPPPFQTGPRQTQFSDKQQSPRSRAADEEESDGAAAESLAKSDRPESAYQTSAEDHHQYSHHDSSPALPEDKPILVLQEATPTSEDDRGFDYLDAVKDTNIAM